MKRNIALATALALGTAAATDLRIYPSFTEVREAVTSTGNTLKVALPQEAWAGVLQGSLDLEGLPFDTAIQNLEPNWLSSLEGKTVYLKDKDGKAQPVTLVRARDLLVKDAAGHFFTVAYDQLQFDAAPPANPQSASQTLTFNLPQPGKGTLSYLTRSVTWTPRYTLKASNAGAQLSALADIRNNANLPYDVKATELYSGDVNVQGQPDLQMNYRAAPAPIAMSADSVAMKIQPQGELRGLYRYDLTQPFTLPANSVVTLPFLTPKLNTFERFVGLQTYFNPGEQKGNLNRYYRFTAAERLPAGPMMVREDGRIVGQTSLSETRADGKVEFTLGEDPDVEYSRSTQTVSQVKDKNGNVTKSTYKVTYTFKSSKDRAIRAEMTEAIGGRVVIIDDAAPVRNQGQAQLKVDIPAKGEVSKSFSVVVDNS